MWMVRSVSVGAVWIMFVVIRCVRVIVWSVICWVSWVSVVCWMKMSRICVLVMMFVMELGFVSWVTV